MNGEILSPLYWAIRDGKISIAQFIITELLTIRADRLEYYYGRDVLWKEHPDIVDVRLYPTKPKHLACHCVDDTVS
jgi:hypothetical protein